MKVNLLVNKCTQRKLFYNPPFLGNDEHDNELYKLLLILTDIAENVTWHTRDIRTIVK